MIFALCALCLRGEKMKLSFPEKADVLVVGAGPAGSMLAYHLARAGLDVLLLDKAKFPRKKTCAGGLNFRTVRLLPFELGPVIERVVSGISFTRNLDDAFLRVYPEPLMVTVQRDCFDDFLVQKATEAGAKFFDSTPFESFLPGNNSIQVKTGSGSCRAKFVIGADGAFSPVAKALGLMKQAAQIIAVHSEIPSSLLSWTEPGIVHIDWGSLKRSYAYVFPKDSSLSVGAGGFGLPAANIKKYQRAFLATRWQKDGAFPFSTAGFILPLRTKREAIEKGRCLLLGDAAGLVDPFTGEGIYYAVRSAQIAAPVVAEAVKTGADSIKAYQEGIDRELMPELECSRLFREIFNLRPAFFHRKIAASDRWWNAMAKILRGEKTFLDVQRKLGRLGNLLLRMSR